MPTSGIASGEPNPIEKEHIMASKVNLCLNDLGMAKGKNAVTEQAVAKVASQGKAKLPT
jgi:hypothetical protein